MLELARRGAVPPLPDRGLPMQAELQGILDRALAFDPKDRWPSAGEMLRALDGYAAAAKLFASQLRFASFLSEHFEAEVVRVRRERERAAQALACGPAVRIDPIETPLEGSSASEAGGERAEETREPPAVTVARKGGRTLALGAAALALALCAALWLILR